MAHWRNGSVFFGLRQLARGGVRAARVTEPRGPIQQIEDFQGADSQAEGLLPLHVKKNIFPLRGKVVLRGRDRL